LSDTAEPGSGLDGPFGITLVVDIDEGLGFLRMTWNFSLDGPSSSEAEWPKMPRLFLRRLSDIALAF